MCIRDSLYRDHAAGRCFSYSTEACELQDQCGTMERCACQNAIGASDCISSEATKEISEINFKKRSVAWQLQGQNHGIGAASNLFLASATDVK